MEKPTASLRQKLIVSVTLILLMAFIATLVVVSVLNIRSSTAGLERIQAKIDRSLVAKGVLLTKNNSVALQGMVEDNGFTAVLELVSSTVKNDEDIVLGTFFDVDEAAWVYAWRENTDGEALSNRSLTRPELDESKVFNDVIYGTSLFDNQDIYLFSAPIVIEEEELGTIYYGLSLESMNQEMAIAREVSRKNLITTLGALVALALLVLALAMLAIRKMAQKITSPLISLTDSASALSRGCYDVSVPIHSQDEIGFLAHSFNTMSLTIQHKIDDLSQLNQAGEKMIEDLTLEDIAKTLLTVSHSYSGSEYAYIMLLDRKSDNSVKVLWQDENPIAGEALLSILELSQEHANVFDEMSTWKSTDNSFSIHKVDAVRRFIIEQNDEVLGYLALVNDKHELDEYRDFYMSLLNIFIVNLRNVQMHLEIDEHNRNLEKKIAERTLALQAKTNDILTMMENLHQGLFTIVGDGTIHPEYSKHLESIFSREDIAQLPYQVLLFEKCHLGSDVTDQILACVASLLGSDELMYEFNSHILVDELVITAPDGKEKILQVDWDPIIFDDVIDKLMVTVRDVTELRALELDAARQRQELEIVGQVLAIEASKFSEFLSNAVSLLNENRSLIEASEGSPLSAQDINALFRNMHTIKGNARTYGLLALTDNVHEAENRYCKMRNGEDTTSTPETLLQDIETVGAGVEEYRRVHEDVLKRASTADSALTNKVEEAALRLVAALLESEHDVSSKDKALELVNTMLNRIGRFGLKELLNDKRVVLEATAGAVGKPMPDFDVECGDIWLENKVKATIDNALTHAMRNSLDHGIESAEKRVDAGKDPQGKVLLNAVHEGGQVLICLSDDGQGLNTQALKIKALASGTSESALSSPLSIAETIFQAGVSTAAEVTDISGRGVGMDAIRGAFESLGGGASIRLGGQLASGNYAFSLVLSVPSQAGSASVNQDTRSISAKAG